MPIGDMRVNEALERRYNHMVLCHLYRFFHIDEGNPKRALSVPVERAVSSMYPVEKSQLFCNTLSGDYILNLMLEMPAEKLEEIRHSLESLVSGAELGELRAGLERMEVEEGYLNATIGIRVPNSKRYANILYQMERNCYAYTRCRYE